MSGKNKVYAQAVNGVVNLIGGAEVGLPLPDYIQEAMPGVDCVDITAMTDKPAEGDYYENGAFITLEERLREAGD